MLEPALTVWEFIPIYEISSFAPSGAVNEKLPSMSVTAPVFVPTTLIDAPMTGSPSSAEVTLPET